MRASGAVLRITPTRARLHTQCGRIRPSWGALRNASGGLLALVWILSWGLLLLTIFSVGEVSKRLEVRALLPPTVSRAEDPPLTAECGGSFERETDVYCVP